MHPYQADLRGQTSAWPPLAREAAVALTLLALLALAGCADSAAPTITEPSLSSNRSEGRGIFQRYVALGTGFSMGASNRRLTPASQSESWPAQLARMAHREMSQPYVEDEGCMAAVLGPMSATCSVAAGVALPTQNLSIHMARASSALAATVENAESFDYGTGFARLLPLVLPPGLTQIDAMHALEPKIVSVEYGMSELLRMLRQPGPVQWLDEWTQSYDAILDEVAKETDLVVLALPPVTNPPGYVWTSQLFTPQNRADLLTEFNVLIPHDPVMFPNGCESGRAVYVPVFINAAVSTGLGWQERGLGPFTADCTSQFFYNQVSISGDMRDWYLWFYAFPMRQHITEQATLRGYATFDMDIIYTSYVQPPFSVMSYMSAAEPFGPYVSADGIYPTAAGNRLLAEAAAKALNERYGLGIPVSAAVLTSK
jgi:hypothetical protein